MSSGNFDLKTVVVTGAGGFVGRHLVAHLGNHGFRVIAVSRRDVAGMVTVQDYVQSPSGDALIHLAEEPDRGKVNRLGEEYAFKSAATVRALSSRFAQRMIYASSSVVYGDQNEIPCKVDTPVVAVDLYSRSKLLNEQTVLASGGAVARLSNLVGIGMSANNVVSDILGQLPGNAAIRVQDDTPVRDFLSVSDAASAFSLMLDNGFCGIVNIGSGIGTSVRAIAELLLGCAGQPSRAICSVKSSGHRSINVLDISETMHALRWAPTISLKRELVEILHNNAKQ